MNTSESATETANRVASPSMLSAPDAYADGLTEALVDEAHWRDRARLVSNARLVFFLLIALAGWLAFGTHLIARTWIFVPTALFITLVIVHDRLLRREERATRMRRFFEDGIARLGNAWAGRGDAGERYRDPRHPYAEDLDLFGVGSLFELLATTRTDAGSDLLASWLLAPSDPATIRARQAAIEELCPRLDLRVEMSVAGDVQASTSADPEALERWAGAPAAALPRATFWLAITATTASTIGLSLWIFSEAGPVPLLAALVLQTLFAAALRSRIVPVLAAAETPVQSLARMASLLVCIESEQFDAPRLVTLRAELDTTGRPPSQELEALRRLVDRRDARLNQFFAPIAAFLLWGTHSALALEAWRARCGPRLAPWIATAGEIEALSSLASFSFENQSDPFPTIREDDVMFFGEGLGHPLLPNEGCVRNDLGLGSVPQAIVMSGSNMSGKSTMLRTVGCNTILALAGAPVRARRLDLSVLHIAASIRIVDSLQDGRSHFMAEILRLRQVVEASRSTPPVLFLLDEILHGTNSHDRRIGAEAVIRGLISTNALGIVTTHDLALTKIVPESEGRLANAHFEDQFEDGQMEFDYALRDGVVEKSNALQLMRSIGLDV